LSTANKSLRNTFPLSTKAKILIVDDNRYNRKILRNALLEANKNLAKNFDIVEGRDGLDILNFVVEDKKNFNSIKCIFTDEVMDYIDGSRTIELLKHMESNNKILKIFTISVLNMEDEGLMEIIKARGADYILKKPLVNRDLEVIIEKVFAN
jgi:CheY-like chemotaxis protein